MRSRGGRKPTLAPPARNELSRLLDAYLAWLAARNYSRFTLHTRRAQLGWFLRWAEERAIVSPGEITRAMLESYQRHLFQRLGPQGKPLSFLQQHARLVAVRAWFRWLARQGHVAANPASDLELPRLPRRLPKEVLTEQEAERVLACAAGDDPVSLRDRAALEILYATGIRRMELARLSLYDLDYERATLAVRQGKGRKDRIVPIGRRALLWAARYVREARPLLASSPDDGTFLLTSGGEPFSLDGLSLLIGKCVARAGIAKRGACHLFRHTCATLMLEGGADLRHIQQMLGHADVSTTQIYTQVSIRELRRAYQLSHPAAQEQGGGAVPRA